MHQAFSYQHFVDLVILTGGGVFQIEFERLFEVRNGLFDGVAEARYVHVEALRDVVRSLLIYAKFDGLHVGKHGEKQVFGKLSAARMVPPVRFLQVANGQPQVTLGRRQTFMAE